MTNMPKTVGAESATISTVDESLKLTEPAGPTMGVTPCQSANSSAEKNSAPLHNSGRASDGKFKPGHPYRFKPGQSGNPKGRPKNVRFLTERLRSQMLRRYPDDRQRRTYGDIMVDKLAWSAVQGDSSSVRQVFDRLEGPARAIAEKDEANVAELLTGIVSQLLTECEDNPEAKRAITAALDKINLEEE